jgi:hypothetical protein
VIHDADKQLKARWGERFAELPSDSRMALRDALLALRADALARAQHQWKAHKAPMALYWKVVGVYAGHLARSLHNNVTQRCTQNPLTGATHDPGKSLQTTGDRRAGP